MKFFCGFTLRMICALALTLATSMTFAETYYHHKDSYYYDKDYSKEKYFQRIATLPVFLNTDINEETVAEIVTASEDGNTVIYTDGVFGGIGFVDIKDPYNPKVIGFLKLEGEPTSVTVRGKYALVASNTSADFVDTSGLL